MDPATSAPDATKPTERERIIKAIRLMSEGTPMKQAADDVGWSYQGLKNRLSREYVAMGAQNALHLAAIYFRSGLIT